MKAKIFMDTIKQAEEVTRLASTCDQEVYIEDGNGLKVRACSILGSLHALEFNELWLTSQGDYYSIFKDFIIDSPLDNQILFNN